MKKSIIYILLFSIIILSSCGTTKFESGLKEIKLGMTKQEVIAILGKNYKILGAVNTPDGYLDTWSYVEPNLVSGASDERVIVNFLNDVLDEWHREQIIKPLPPENSYNEN